MIIGGVHNVCKKLGEYNMDIINDRRGRGGGKNKNQHAARRWIENSIERSFY